jgi:hypothetical protein
VVRAVTLTQLVEAAQRGQRTPPPANAGSRLAGR